MMNAAVRSVSMMRRKSAVSISCMGRRLITAALFTRMSTGPKVFAISASISRIWSSFVTSPT